MNNRFKFRVIRGKNPFTPTGTILHFALGDEVGFGKDDIVEQCTGLKDKNGNLIYEGDIIKDKFDNTYLIKWFNAKFICEDQAEMQPIFSPRQELLLNWGVKIIGNIHEQPEQKDK